MIKEMFWSIYMEDNEIWKKLSGYENYEVSSFGKIKNQKTGRILHH